jgi:hypothetical protein
MQVGSSPLVAMAFPMSKACGSAQGFIPTRWNGWLKPMLLPA